MRERQGWLRWADVPGLSDGEIRCVRFGIEPPAERVAALRALLSPDELARADRFLVERHRARFAAARGFLRELLATHTGVAAGDLRFSYAEHGKPRLAFPEDGPCFNLSHSGALAVAALSRGLELGVDIERVRERVRLAAIARRFFSPAEADDLLSRPEDERTPAFFRCWTRKEAFLKAKGAGLSLPLDGFRVTLGHDRDARLVEVAWDPEEANRWQLMAFPAGDGYSGAVVAASHPRLHLTLFDWA